MKHLIIDCTKTYAHNWIVVLVRFDNGEDFEDVGFLHYSDESDFRAAHSTEQDLVKHVVQSDMIGLDGITGVEVLGFDDFNASGWYPSDLDDLWEYCLTPDSH